MLMRLRSVCLGQTLFLDEADREGVESCFRTVKFRWPSRGAGIRSLR